MRLLDVVERDGEGLTARFVALEREVSASEMMDAGVGGIAYRQRRDAANSDKQT